METATVEMYNGSEVVEDLLERERATSYKTGGKFAQHVNRPQASMIRQSLENSGFVRNTMDPWLLTKRAGMVVSSTASYCSSTGMFVLHVKKI
jgi:hypothetical protein